MLEIDAIFFDLDGTLVDSRRDIYNSVNYMLDTLGLEKKSFEEVVSYIGGGVDDLVSKVLKEHDDRLHEKALKLFREHYSEHSTDETVLYPNVLEVLDHFNEKQLMLVTNRPRGLSELTIESLGIGAFFSYLIGGDEMTCLKPSACQIERAIEKLQYQGSVKKLIMVGDMTSDVQAAKNAGILSCAVTYGIGDPDDLKNADPDLLIDDISELMNLLR